MSRSLLLVAVPAGAIAIVALVAGSRSHPAPSVTTTTQGTATATTATTATTTTNATTSSVTPATNATTAPMTSSRSDREGRAASATPSTDGTSAAPAGDRVAAPEQHGDLRAPAKGSTPNEPTANGAVALGGFGATADAPPSSSAPSTGGNRTWHRPEELKLTIGTDTVDVAAREAFHTGADLPVLYVAGRKHTSSTFQSPNVIRFTGVGVVSPGDEIAIAYGKGTPTVIRKGAVR